MNGVDERKQRVAFFRRWAIDGGRVWATLARHLLLPSGEQSLKIDLARSKIRWPMPTH